MAAIKTDKPNVVIIQQICPHYRAPLFQLLAQKLSLCLFYGKGEGTGSFQNAKNMQGFRHKRILSIAKGFDALEIGFYISWFPTLLWHLIKERPTLIITEGSFNVLNNISVLLYAKLAKIPFIFWDPGRDIKKPKKIIRTIFEPFFIFFFIRRARACMTYGELGKHYFLANGVPEEKIFIIPNSAVSPFTTRLDEESLENIRKEKERLHINDKKVLLYAGSIEKRKKIENLLRAFQKIKSKYNNIALLIIGDGNEMDTLKQWIVDNCLLDTHLLGRITTTMDLYFMLCDIFVLPGYSTIAISQALYFGKPVIAAAHGGVEYGIIQDNVNGYLIEKDNLPQLTDTIEKLLLDDKTRQRLSENARETGKDLTIENMVKEILRAVEYCHAHTQ